MALLCEVCKQPTLSRKDRFCPQHEAQMLARMANDGYLVSVPPPSKSRGAAEVEDVNETKYGRDE